MIIDPDFVKRKPISSIIVYEIPLTRIAKEFVGQEITANVVALGAIAALTDCVSKDAIKKAILSSTPEGTEKVNEKAFEYGYKFGNDAYAKKLNSQNALISGQEKVRYSKES